MSKRIVLLISHKYPYQPPIEVFLHNELPYIVDEANAVCIFTTARGIDTDARYNYPSGVECRSIMNCDFSIEQLMGFIFAIRKTGKDSLKELWTNKRSLKSLIEILRCYAWAITRYSKVHRILKVMDIGPDDEVVVYSYWFGCYSVLASIIKLSLEAKIGCKNVQCISRAHGMGDLYPANGLQFHPGYEILKKELNCIYSISNVGCNYLVEEFQDNNICTYRLGVSGIDKVILCQPRDYIVIVSCSTINSNKRVEKIAQVIAAITGAQIKWTHFGSGTGIEKLNEKLQEMMPETTFASLAGNCRNSDILQFYYEEVPDLFINLSVVEGLPVSIMEAMAYSIPVMAPNIGAISEIIDDQENGYLVDRDEDVDSLRIIVEKYISLTIKERNQMRERAFEKWRKLYSMHDNYKRFARDIWRQTYD